MKTTITYELSDYMKIAALVSNNASDDSSEYEVEYSNGGHTLILTVSHEVEYRTETGGSYEGYDFERLSRVASEFFDVEDLGCYDGEGNEINSDFDANKLYQLLN